MNIVLIEDSKSFRVSIKAMLASKGEVYAVEAPSVAFRILEAENIDLIICDYILPEMTGLEVLSKVKVEYPDIEVIMISSTGDMDTVIDALRKGAADFIKKPFTTTELWVSIERTQKFASIQNDLKQTKKKNKVLKQLIESDSVVNIIGKNNTIKEIKEQMELVAQTPDTSVLLLGESGTGKELIARGIHNLSKRKNELFGAVNMSAIPENLFESEFFGHKKGSFTGAISDKAGWFESANNGSLFFDEVGEMNLNLQVKLLRVLEDRKYIKVGHQKEQTFDIRIIAATNKTVEDLTSGKDFRIDLFHRLGTFTIYIPPLRDRLDDLPEITDYFIHIIAKKMGKPALKVNKQVYTQLQGYNFPGNIRELRNMIERAIIICTSGELLPKHFSILGMQTSALTCDSAPENSLNLEVVEKLTIEKALKKANFNKSEAAKLLNLEWNALYRRITKHNIELPATKKVE